MTVTRASPPRKPRSSRTGRATMADVAERVGVSAMTVSRAFKTPDRVADSLRERIQAAARDLGYLPNRAASQLASARSMTIAVLIPSLTNTVFIDTVAGIHQVMHPEGYQILIGVTGYSGDGEERLLETYLEYNPDGLLLTGLGHSAATWTRLRGLAIPTVHMMELSDRPDIYAVGLSQIEGGQAMTRRLIERGYRRIGFVAAQLDERTIRRSEGYRRAMQEAGLYDANLELLSPEPSSIGFGAELLDRMLAQAPDCDALFFCNDDLAQGAIYRCRRLGIAVPDRLAIAGFNDLAASAWTVPALTTVATPRFAIGREAASMLLSLLRGKRPERTCLDLGFTVMERETTGTRS